MPWILIHFLLFCLCLSKEVFWVSPFNFSFRAQLSSLLFLRSTFLERNKNCTELLDDDSFVKMYVPLSCRNAAHGFSLIQVDSMKVTMKDILQKALKRRKGSQRGSGGSFVAFFRGKCAFSWGYFISLFSCCEKCTIFSVDIVICGTTLKLFCAQVCVLDAARGRQRRKCLMFAAKQCIRYCKYFFMVTKPFVLKSSQW